MKISPILPSQLTLSPAIFIRIQKEAMTSSGAVSRWRIAPTIKDFPAMSETAVGWALVLPTSGKRGRLDIDKVMVVYNHYFILLLVLEGC